MPSQAYQGRLSGLELCAQTDKAFTILAKVKGYFQWWYATRKNVMNE